MHLKHGPSQEDTWESSVAKSRKRANGNSKTWAEANPPNLKVSLTNCQLVAGEGARGTIASKKVQKIKIQTR